LADCDAAAANGCQAVGLRARAAAAAGASAATRVAVCSDVLAALP